MPVANATDGTLVIFVITGIWAYALGKKGGKGTISGRLAALVSIGIAFWLILGALDAPTAMDVASGTLRGVNAVMSAVGVILKA